MLHFALNQNLTNNLNVKYDEDDDYVKIFYNGTWQRWQKAHLQQLVYFSPSTGYNLDVLGAITDSGSGITSWPYYTHTVNANNVNYHVQGASGNGYGIFTTTNFVDLTHYTTLHLQGSMYLSKGTGGSYGSGSGTCSIQLLDENGNYHTVCTGPASSTSAVSVNLTGGLTEYSGNYKIVVKVTVNISSATVANDLNVTSFYLD